MHGCYSLYFSHHLVFQHQDEGADVQEEDDRTEVFSRRKLESNWDRYAESERQEPDDDTPTQRGTDYLVLLESAGKTWSRKDLEEFVFVFVKRTHRSSSALSRSQVRRLSFPKQLDTRLVLTHLDLDLCT